MYSIYKTILSIFLAYDLFFASSANDDNCLDPDAESDVHSRKKLLYILSGDIIKSCRLMNSALIEYRDAQEEYEKIIPERRKSIEDHKKYKDLCREEIKQILNNDFSISDSDFKKICDLIKCYNENQSVNRCQDFNPPVSDIHSIIMKCICSRISMANLYRDIYFSMPSSVQEKIDGCIARLAGSTNCSIYDSITKHLNELYSTTVSCDNNDQLRRVNRIKKIDNEQIKVDLAIYDRFLKAKSTFKNYLKDLAMLKRCSVGINNFIIANTNGNT